MLKYLQAYGQDGWVALADTNNNHLDGSAVVLDGKIIVCGGRAPPTADCERYDVEANAWSPMASMQQPRRWFGMTVYDGEVFAMGDYDGDRYSVEKYNAGNDSWAIQKDELCCEGYYSLNGACAFDSHCQ